MPKVTVNGVELEVPGGITVLQACEMAGVEIPRFCYHERLSIAGNCRMCLVEMEKSPKPVASCAMPVADGQVIKTNTATVQKARRGVMEFLLINHPLDCPICDQGGECDLQDQAVGYGFDRSRYAENKRAVEDKYMGPLVKTSMNRCIHCTRCVRFSTEVAGVDDLGMLNRGEHAEITTYLEKAIASELSANVIDLCPVGALTSKPYAFAARPWELRKFEGIDVLDAVGSNIRVDARGREVMRVLPRLHEGINEEWISDKTRYAIDGLKRQRLDRPYIRENDKLRPAEWAEALAVVASKLQNTSASKVAAIAGDQCDAESMFALKQLMGAIGSPHLDCRQDGAKLPTGSRSAYLFNTSIAGIEQADALLLIGTNPRWEAPIINARIRKRWLSGQLKIAMIGAKIDLTYDYQHIGMGPESLQQIASGQHKFSEVLKSAKAPMIIVGAGALARPDGAAILATAAAFAEKTGMIRPEGDGWNGFNVLHTAASRVGGLDMGFVPQQGGRDRDGIVHGCAVGDIEVLYLLGADEIEMQKLGKAFVIYQGHHGDAGAHRADIVLPGAAYTEKDGTYVNTEGRVQLSWRAAFPPGDAREDWTILRALSEKMGRTLPFDNLDQLRQKLVAAYPSFANIDQLPQSKWQTVPAVKAAVESVPFKPFIDNFYMTCAISRASATMAECSAVFAAGSAERTGTHG